MDEPPLPPAVEEDVIRRMFRLAEGLGITVDAREPSWAVLRAAAVNEIAAEAVAGGDPHAQAIWAEMNAYAAQLDAADAATAAEFDRLVAGLDEEPDDG